MEKIKPVAVSTVFPATADIVWDLLLNIDTLEYIAKPLMAFMPFQQGAGEAAWTVGGVYDFKILILGLLPFGGCHTIEVKKIDKAAFVIQTREYNKTVTVWNHRIVLTPLPDGNTKYTDIVDIYAGRLTPAVVLWSKVFYRHRQRKWGKLLHAKRVKT